MEEREKLSSRLGFILLSAGCAIGIGNVWKFPYMCGQYGGGSFVLLYLFFLIVMGVPMMTMEFSIGRASQKSPFLSLKVLQKENSKWHLHGYLAFAGNYLLMMFYTIVAGWMLHYFYLTAIGTFEGIDASGVQEIYSNMLLQPHVLIFWAVIVICVGYYICSLGLQNGVEKITKVMMLLLFGIIIVLAINSLTLENSIEGLKFYLLPDFERMKEIGIVSSIVGAMNQSFFTLSLGIGAMAIFGSYIDRKYSLFGESLRVAVLDTFVAVVSGLIIFPACFAFGVNPDSGPNLIFITLPNIFNNMPLGRLWGSLFFIFLAFAAFSTVITVFEGLIASTCDMTSWTRKKAVIVNCIATILLSLPCALGFNILSDIQPFGIGNIMDFEDFLVSNILLPIGALIYLLFCTSKYGWGWKNFLKEANTGKGIKMPNAYRLYMTYVLPLMILFIFIMGLVDKFM